MTMLIVSVCCPVAEAVLVDAVRILDIGDRMRCNSKGPRIFWRGLNPDDRGWLLFVVFLIDNIWDAMPLSVRTLSLIDSI